jgi:hypothetical protein
MAMDALEDGRYYCPSKETKTHPKQKQHTNYVTSFVMLVFSF